MSPSFDPAAFRAYLAKTFPTADPRSEWIDLGMTYLRFELGDPHPNGSDARVAQAVERALALFRDVFAAGEPLVLIVKDWDWSGDEWRPSDPPGHLFSLIRGFDADAAVAEEIEVEGGGAYRQLLVPTTAAELDLEAIFRGIAHLEQGRRPRINASVHFVAPGRGLAFHMYDDRGCLVHADDPARLRALYRERHDWLIDHPPERERFAAAFGDSSSRR